VDELSARQDELEGLRRRVTCGRDFRRLVELTRQLNEARAANEQLRAQLGTRPPGVTVATLTADGTLRRTTATTASSASSPSVAA